MEHKIRHYNDFPKMRRLEKFTRTISQLFLNTNKNFKQCYSSLRKSRGASYNIRTYRLDKKFVAYFASRTCGHSINFSKNHFKLIHCFHGVSLLDRYKNDH